MRLTDRQIVSYLDAQRIGIEPRPKAEDISGVTVDIHLGNEFRVLEDHAAPYIDISGPREAIESAINQIILRQNVEQKKRGRQKHPSSGRRGRHG